MHILVAPNAFKNSLTAEEASEAIQKGLNQSSLVFTSECFPIGDGGDGTADLIIRKFNGTRIKTQAKDPLGRTILVSFGLIDNDRTAVIEMAAASGVRLLKQEERSPLIATSFGTGELMLRALELGVTKIILTMGGSATVDGGAGILNALGIKFLDSKARKLSGKPQDMKDLVSIDYSDIDHRISGCEVLILCDVENELLGSNGAATVFGPQKGADPEGVKKLETALSVFSGLTEKETGIAIHSLKHGGTAGGAAAGLHAHIGAKLVNGIDYFMRLTGFEHALEKSNLLITGEGSMDEQTLHGKAPFGVARMAKSKGIPVIGLAGKIPAESKDQLSKYFDVLQTISLELIDVETALQNTASDLIKTSCEIGRLLAASEGKMLVNFPPRSSKS